MARLIAGRLAQMAATLLVVSALVWLVMGLMPGDPADLAMMADPALTVADIERLRAAHGLDRPLQQPARGGLSAPPRGRRPRAASAAPGAGVPGRGSPPCCAASAAFPASTPCP